jgi:hypothetical protein
MSRVKSKVWKKSERGKCEDCRKHRATKFFGWSKLCGWCFRRFMSQLDQPEQDRP